VIDREHDLSLVRQAEVLDLSRISLYYVAKQPSDVDLELMREIDRLHLERPSPVRGCCATCSARRVTTSVAGTSGL